MNNVDEQIDVTGRAILATTIACARCHDHKFDPIPTKDYYSLAGIFRSTADSYGLARESARSRRSISTRTLPEADRLRLSSGRAAPPPSLTTARRERRKVHSRLRALFKPLEIEPLAMGVTDVPGPSDTAQLLHGDLDDRRPGRPARLSHDSVRWWRAPTIDPAPQRPARTGPMDHPR